MIAVRDECAHEPYFTFIDERVHMDGFEKKYNSVRSCYTRDIIATVHLKVCAFYWI